MTRKKLEVNSLNKLQEHDSVVEIHQNHVGLPLILHPIANSKTTSWLVYRYLFILLPDRFSVI